jgi:hypothetical protein
MPAFSTQTIACPVCEASGEFQLAEAVDAQELPGLRESIVDGSFQRIACPRCGARFRVEPAFTFTDVERGQYIGVWPIAMREQWQDYAERTRLAFEAAHPEGSGLQARAVFGWPALAEKILSAHAGIDDRTLEVVKVATLRHRYTDVVPGRRELRLAAFGDNELVIGWVDPKAEAISDVVRVPRAIVAEIEADPASWRALRESVVEGLVVDFQRATLLP